MVNRGIDGMSDEEAQPAKPLTRLFHRERVEYWALFAEIIAAVAVVLSLIFVGVQLREYNKVARGEARNQTMEQWSNVRRSIYTDAGTAEIYARGKADPDSLDDTERLRFNYILTETTLAVYQMYARWDDGYLPLENFEGGVQGMLTELCTPGGRARLQQVRQDSFSGFVEEIEKRIPDFEATTGADCGEPPAG
jgi:hypothetical protein